MALSTGDSATDVCEYSKNCQVKTGKTITNREKEILVMIANGKTSSQIAEKLSISLKTVETHRKNLLKKMNAENACHLIYITVKRSII